MALKTGLGTLADLLRNTNLVSTVDLSLVNETIQRELAIHNQLAVEMVADMAEPTTQPLFGVGTSETGELVPADEFTRAPTQRVTGDQNLGIPLEGWQYAIGWTRKYFLNATVQEFARQVDAAQKAHRKKIIATMKRAIFGPANFTWTDHLARPALNLPVKRFHNADSWSIPEGPNGEVFDGSTHTHYLANATLTAAAALSAVNTVAEHGYTDSLRLIINAADETAFRALTGFMAYPDPRLTIPSTAQPTKSTQVFKTDNKAIGLFGMAEVWVKPWGIANYLVVTDVGSPDKPLAFRQSAGGVQGLTIAAELDVFPLHAQYMEAEFGFGVRTRSNGAVLRFNNGTYAAPTITG